MKNDEATTMQEKNQAIQFPGDLRDWFAGMALQGQLALLEVQGAMAKELITSQDLAGACFEYADAMLLARLNKPEALRAGE
jgi:hypothetical protein